MCSPKQEVYLHQKLVLLDLSMVHLEFLVVVQAIHLEIQDWVAYIQLPVVDRLPALAGLRLLGRQHHLRRQGLSVLRHRPGGSRGDWSGVLSVGREGGLAYAVGGGRATGGAGTSRRGAGAAG